MLLKLSLHNEGKGGLRVLRERAGLELALSALSGSDPVRVGTRKSLLTAGQQIRADSLCFGRGCREVWVA